MTVDLGVHVPQWGPGATRAGVLAVARTAEEVGFSSVWVADHLAMPVKSESDYPYRRGGVPFDADEGFLEAIATLAVIAGATERVRLGTSVLVVPMRNPLELAKVLATLDVLSDGRLELACGAGWWREEFDALDVPFDHRGLRFDEMLQALRLLWAEGRAAFSGSTFGFEEVVSLPCPIQRPAPPIWIGGSSPAGMRRAVRQGDGWHAVGGNPERLATGIDELRRIANEHGRDPSTLKLSTSAGLSLDAEVALERLSAMADLGLDQVVFNVPLDDPDDICQALRRVGPDLVRAAVSR